MTLIELTRDGGDTWEPLFEAGGEGIEGAVAAWNARLVQTFSLRVVRDPVHLPFGTTLARIDFAQVKQERAGVPA